MTYDIDPEVMRLRNRKNSRNSPWRKKGFFVNNSPWSKGPVLNTTRARACWNEIQKSKQTEEKGNASTPHDPESAGPPLEKHLP